MPQNNFFDNIARHGLPLDRNDLFEDIDKYKKMDPIKLYLTFIINNSNNLMSIFEVKLKSEDYIYTPQFSYRFCF